MGRTSRALLIGLVSGVGCTPEAAYDPPQVVDATPTAAVCPFGLQILGVGTDGSRAPRPVTVRLEDHAVLVAHRRRGAGLAGFAPEAAQQYVDGAWTSAVAGQVVEPCDTGTHDELSPLPASGPMGTAARGRWLIAACGPRADAPLASTLVDQDAPPASWLDAPCDDDLWLWLATARSCAEIALRFPDAPGGVYTIDPDGPGGASPGAAFCDQRTAGGGWTQILGVKDDGSAPPVIERPATLSPGLAAASRLEGYVAAPLLAAFPSRGPFLELRFYCRRESGARVHVVTQSVDVPNYMLSRGATPPPARGSYYRVDGTMNWDPTIYAVAPEDSSQLGQNDLLWGNDQVSEPRVSWTGRWGESIQGADPADRVASHPMVIEPSEAGGTPTAVRRGYRATKDARECDGPTGSSPGEWRVFAR